jgi:hypothetical protein
VQGLTTPYVFMRARYLAMTPLPVPTSSVGAAYLTLSVTNLNRPLVLPINLGLMDQSSAPCPAAATTMMQCTP